MELTIRRVETQADMDDALSVRRAVFIEEQQVAEEDEIDDADRDGGWRGKVVQMVAYDDGRPVATGRLLHENEDIAHIGRVAVLAEHRKSGCGRALMLALQDAARERGYRQITLAAQLHAIPFYERLGYTARGDVFLDTNIEHRWMDLSI